MSKKQSINTINTLIQVYIIQETTHVLNVTPPARLSMHICWELKTQALGQRHTEERRAVSRYRLVQASIGLSSLPSSS